MLIRLAALALCLGCSARTRVDVPVAQRESTPVFRWTLGALPCEARRSGSDRCTGWADGQYTAVAYAPGDDDPRVPVVAYKGSHAGMPRRWLRFVALGSGPGSPVLAIVREMVVVAQVAGDGIHLVTLDATDGRVLTRGKLGRAGVSAAQLEVDGDRLVIHARLAAGGGYLAVVDPARLVAIAEREVRARSIRETIRSLEDGAVVAAQHGTLVNGYRIDRADPQLVLSRPGRWSAELSVSDALEHSLEYLSGVTLHQTNDLVLATLHSVSLKRHLVFAFDGASGKQHWSRRFTGVGLAPLWLISTYVDGDELVVQTQTQIPTACSVGIADGLERACVEHAPSGDRGVIDHARVEPSS